MAPRIGRPRSCECGICKKCKCRDYMRRWYATKSPEERRVMREGRDKGRERARDRERDNSPARREAHRARCEEWRLRNPDKTRAHRIINSAIARGEVVRQPCEVCGAEKVHAHHDSYNQPLAVRWLCPVHHAAVHRKREF